jgi:cytosine/adenosine deaminase-related metal-dependent hydrolase
MLLLLLPCPERTRLRFWGKMPVVVERGSRETSPFEAAYTAPVVDAPAAPAAGAANRELMPRAVPAQAFALRGCVLTPKRRIEDGYVVVGAGPEISAVQETRPDVPVTETDGVILPGLIDLHGHPEFNVFAAWEPPQRFVNRYAWRGSDLYHRLIRDPQNVLLDRLPPKTQLRYAEIRALVGGVTAIQGTGGTVASFRAEALVRNVDKWIFGGQVGRSMIDLPSGSRGADDLKSILAGITAGDVKAFYIHLAEGHPSNKRSQEEFRKLVDLNALTASTVVIHGTALTREQLGDLKDAGAKLVWSPQSNLRLYGETTRVEDALDLGLPVALGADWLPSGSTSLLEEMKVARRVLASRGQPLSARKFVEMVTTGAATIAGLDDRLGLLEQGRPADLVVLERRHDDPWENVVAADPSWVELVMIDGDLTYGRADWMSTLSSPDHRDRLEPLSAWGKPMLLDSSYEVHAGTEPAPTLAELRHDLIAQYPQVGPIFA